MSDRLLTAAELERDLLASAASLLNILNGIQAAANAGDHQGMTRAAELIPWAESIRAKWAEVYRETCEREAAEVTA